MINSEEEIKENEMGHRACFFVSALAPEPGAKQSPQAGQPGGCDPRQRSEGKGAKCQRKQHNIARPRGNLVGSLEGIWECSSSVLSLIHI